MERGQHSIWYARRQLIFRKYLGLRPRRPRRNYAYNENTNDKRKRLLAEAAQVRKDKAEFERMGYV